MKSIVPNKLRRGDHIRVISPSRSLSLIHQETRDIAVSTLENMGLKVSYSKHAEERNNFV